MATSLLNTVGQLRASTQASTSRLRLYSTASKARRPAPRTHRIPASPSSPSVNSTAPLPRIVHPSPPPAVPHVDSAAAGRRGIDKAKVTSEPYDLSRQNWMDPPLVAKARAKSTKQRSVWESYLVLDAKTRLLFSLGLGAFALIGLYAGDYFVPDSEEEVAFKRGEEVHPSPSDSQGNTGGAVKA